MLKTDSLILLRCPFVQRVSISVTKYHIIITGNTAVTCLYRLHVDVCLVCCSVIDVAFVLDSSFKSQGQSAWNEMISFVNSVIDRLSISEYALRVAFVRYSNSGTVEFQFITYSDSASTKQRISSITYLGSSGNNLASALDLLRTQVFQSSAGARSLAPWVAVVVTDRSPNIRTGDTVSVANQDRAATIQIIPVGILGPGQLDRRLLFQIAFTADRVSTVNTYSELSTVVSQVTHWICNSHLGKYQIFANIIESKLLKNTGNIK